MSYISNIPILAIIVPFAFAFIIGLFQDKFLKLKQFLSIAATFITLISALLLIKPIMIDKMISVYWLGNWVPEKFKAIGIGLEVDGLGLFVGLIIALTCFLSAIYSLKYMERDTGLEKYYALFLLLTGSMMGFVFTGDLFNMYVMLEIMTFAAVALTAFRNHIYKSIEAGFKYIVTGSIGSSLILLGTCLIYAQVNTLNLAEISVKLQVYGFTPVTILALALILVGYSVKAFLVPCHTWPPDAHMAAPSSISMLLSGVMSKTGIYALIRISYLVFQAQGNNALAFLIIFWGTITMVVGVSMALIQTDFKRLLAFHSVSQLGYIAVGIGVGLISVGSISTLGAMGGLYHMLNHASFKCLLFLCAGAVLYSTGTTDLNLLGGLAKRMPFTTIVFLIGAASISGIPPFNGFVSKWLIYQATFEAGYAWVTVIALLVSVMTLASFVKVAHSAFFGQLKESNYKTKEVPMVMKLPMAILALICFIGGVMPGAISKYLLEPAAYSMFNLKGYIDSIFGRGFAEKILSREISIPRLNYFIVGYWKPEAWLTLFIVAMIAVIVCISLNHKYFGVRHEFEDKENGTIEKIVKRRSIEGEKDINEIEEKVKELAEATRYETFTGGELEGFSHVGAHDLFWGMKYQFNGYFNRLHKAHSGVVNDYVLWIFGCLAIVIIYCFVAL